MDKIRILKQLKKQLDVCMTLSKTLKIFKDLIITEEDITIDLIDGITHMEQNFFVDQNMF